MPLCSALIVDSDSVAIASLVSLLEARGIEARSVTTAEEAFREAEMGAFDVVILDPAPAVSVEPLSAIIPRFGDVPVIVVSSGGGKRAVEAIRAGAADFADKPCDREEMGYLLEKILASRDPDPMRPPPADVPESGVLGDSKAIRRVLDLVRRVAPADSIVLVRGESGTGKELVARAIHAQSRRSAGPFVKVHCAGLPESLLESELFGYEKGAFTGASSRKPGRVELAAEGTLFLDEIGDVTPAMQVKLLRLLQDRQYERLGGTATLEADVRFVAATHRDLEKMIQKGEFREDLFYRLHVVPIWLPPLWARKEDIALLSKRFCGVFADAHGKHGTLLSDEAVVALSAERWPGNVRQLQNFVERLVVLAESKTIRAEDVRRELSPTVTFATRSTADGKLVLETTLRDSARASAVVPLEVALRTAEREAIERALRHAKGNRSLAARLLGVGRTTLYAKLEEHGLGKGGGAEKGL